MEIVAVCVLCISGVIFAVYLGEQNKLFGQVILLVLSVFIMILVINKVSGLLSIITIIQEIAGVQSTYIEVLLKMMGVIFVAEFTADICEQEGYKGVGKQVLLFGRAAVLMVGYPLLLEFVEMMRKLLT